VNKSLKTIISSSFFTQFFTQCSTGKKEYAAKFTLTKNTFINHFAEETNKMVGSKWMILQILLSSNLGTMIKKIFV